MEISATNSLINSTIVPKTTGETAAPNAYGIGQANQPKVELSPQGKILQQTEQALKAAQPVNDNKAAQPEEKEPIAQDFVRVSSSIGKGAQSNALTSEQALDVYRSIEQYL